MVGVVRIMCAKKCAQKYHTHLMKKKHPFSLLLAALYTLYCTGNRHSDKCNTSGFIIAIV